MASDYIPAVQEARTLCHLASPTSSSSSNQSSYPFEKKRVLEPVVCEILETDAHPTDAVLHQFGLYCQHRSFNPLRHPPSLDRRSAPVTAVYDRLKKRFKAPFKVVRMGFEHYRDSGLRADKNQKKRQCQFALNGASRPTVTFCWRLILTYRFKRPACLIPASSFSSTASVGHGHDPKLYTPE
jgi:hypothetical protein